MIITCPGCEKELIIPDTNPPRVRCRSCKTTFSIEYSEPSTISDICVPFKQKVKRTWKKHKGKIIAGIGIAVTAGGAALYLNSQNNPSKESTDAQSGTTDILQPDLSRVADSVTAGLQTAGTILSNAYINAITEATSNQPDRYDLAVDPFATDDEDEEPQEDTAYEQKEILVSGGKVKLSGNRRASQKKRETAAENGYPNLAPNETWRVSSTRVIETPIKEP